MGCQESFKQSNSYTLVVFWVILLANACNWIAISTTAWSVIYLPYDTSGDTHIGLWRRCRTKLITGCTSIDGWADTTYGIVQGMAALGFAILNLGHIVHLLFIFVDRWKRSEETGTVSGVLFIAASFIWAMGCVVYAFGYSEVGAVYGYSYGFGIAAGILSLVSGILMIIAARSDDPYKARQRSGDNRGASRF